MFSIILLVKQLLSIYVFLGPFFCYGWCQDCKLQYVLEPPSTISCNPYMWRELKLKCLVQGTASIGRRVKMAWFHISLDNITSNVTELSSLTRSFRHRTVTQNNNWNLTSYLTLSGLTYPRHAGKWFCQPTLDGNLVLPSNMLTIGQVESGFTCTDIQVQGTTRCAYFFSVPSTTDPTFSSNPTTTINSPEVSLPSVYYSSSNIQKPVMPSSSLTVDPTPSHPASTMLQSFTGQISTTSSSGVLPVDLTPSHPASTMLQSFTDQISTTSSSGVLPTPLSDGPSQDRPTEMLSTSSLDGPSQDRPTEMLPTPSFDGPSQDRPSEMLPTDRPSENLWVYALTVIVAVFAMIIIVLVILLVGFFIKNKHSKLVASAVNLSTCDLSTNSAYGHTNNVLIDTEEPLYSVISPIDLENSYILPNEKPPSPEKMSPPVEKHPENDYFRPSEYLEVKL